MTSKRANRYPPELRERAVRMLLEQRSEYHSEHAAINSIAPKTGCSQRGYVSMNAIMVPAVAGSQAMSVSVSKSWSKKFVNCGAATIFCARPQLILRRRRCVGAGPVGPATVRHYPSLGQRLAVRVAGVRATISKT